MRLSRPIAEHFAAFPAETGVLDDVREFAQSALSATGLGRHAVAGLLLAIEEAITNVIRHGYLYGPGRVQVRIRRTKRTVEIVVTDSGRPYEVDFNATPDPQELARTGRRGGLGLLLLRKVTDRIDYRRVNNQNILALIKHIRTIPGPAHFRSSMRRRIAWIGGTAVAIAVATGAYLLEGGTRRATTDEFVDRWTEYGRTAAASATQEIFNERSDVEVDQFVVELKKAHPYVRYLVILDHEGRIRADSEGPQNLHELYVPPAGVPVGRDGHWPVPFGEETVYHFSSDMALADQGVGSVVFGVPESMLKAQLEARQARILTWSVLALIAGELLVVLIAFGISRPLYRLGDILQRAKSEGARIPPSNGAPDEIRQVLDAVNEVTEAVVAAEKQFAQRQAAQRELKQAQQLQRALVPLELPEIPGYDAAAMLRMARHVGGDYYDLIPLDADREQWLLIVADVAGKGFPAALVMTAVRTAVRLLAPGFQTPAEILTALDDYLCRHHPGGPFVTAVCAVLELRTHRLTVASAGHVPTVYLRAQDRVTAPVNPRGRPLGIRADNSDLSSFSTSLASWSCNMNAGDLAVFYTDGLSEACGPDGEAYGTAGVETALKETSAASAADTVQAILRHFESHAGGIPVSDDATLMVLRRLVARTEAPARDQSGNGDGSSARLLDDWLLERRITLRGEGEHRRRAGDLLAAVADHPEWSDADLGTAVEPIRDSESTAGNESIARLLNELGLDGRAARQAFAGWARDREKASG